MYVDCKILQPSVQSTHSHDVFLFRLTNIEPVKKNFCFKLHRAIYTSFSMWPLRDSCNLIIRSSLKIRKRLFWRHFCGSCKICQKWRRIGCVIPRSKLQRGITQPILKLFWHICTYLAKFPRLMSISMVPPAGTMSISLTTSLWRLRWRAIEKCRFTSVRRRSRFTLRGEGEERKSWWNGDSLKNWFLIFIMGLSFLITPERGNEIIVCTGVRDRLKDGL